ncbi:hypothetical protein [Actinosynnema mirum]|uniref:Uncharacterized protein n=1 Tax=Actinosynnema mirum (strain ATCC 29888 / DSM 43827 / JCM 3225 / NBRC 14064 / NCIMB 13271 / NRRL B-12336 / IMRU 3971 / 101) TaxID=446462 RepID=C6WC57_ACTMD|nr:hypothetical protein [Actinosynnema mirum]ACU39445.1 hypothetical protein Amir_5629 [Actinosynnema mirum DSM 43827]
MAATAVTLNRLDHRTAAVKATPVACDAVNGNKVANSGSLRLEFTSSAGGTVTISFPNAVDGQAVTPLTYTFTGAQTRIAAGWPPNIYGPELQFTASVNTITVLAEEV